MIRRIFLAGFFAIAATEAAVGQTIYLETFGPSSGAAPVSSVGWANDITANPNRIFVENDGVVFAFAGTVTTDAFYTSTALDTGATGQAFPTINPGSYPFGVTLAIDIRAGYNPDEVRSRFAVQINGGNWYSSTTILAVPTTQGGGLLNYSMPFNPAAAGWNNLTVTGTGSNTTPAVIGGPAASNLVGNITGAGLIVTYGPVITAGGGTHDFDNFQIQATAKPGDVNLDTVVNLADLTIIRTNFRKSVTSRIMGDVTNDGFVNFNDFRQWKDNYVSPGGVAADSAIPEPSVGTLLAVALVATCILHRRNSRTLSSFSR